jgi:[NiFe] hydrogenase diaphorase moiety large subunit
LKTLLSGEEFIMNTTAEVVQEACNAYAKKPDRLLDICRAVQQKCGCVSDDSIDGIAEALRMPRVEVEGLVTFYAFLSKEQKAPVVIRICNDIVDDMYGGDEVAKVFSEELGIPVGATTPDGKISLEYTACIGMSDQAPAILVNDVVMTYMSGDRVRQIVRGLREHGDPHRLVRRLGDGRNEHPLVHSMVRNCIRKTGAVVLGDYTPDAGLQKAVAMSPVEVIRDIKTARLRGRGGAGFPVGMKWEFTRAADGADRYVICNADEGEPGTFKDRVILTERSDLMFEGMTIAGYALGARQGIVYLRGEYEYLRNYLEHVLADRRAKHLLGEDILGKKGFSFDIRIQMGAGAYICGEETALINSCEGKRGEPKNRPPFPAQKGYLEGPTSVNNCETYCCAARILDKGPGWFAQMGSKGSPGTKLLSISGDCPSPGVYEYPFGTKLRTILEEVGALDAQAVQVGGPSGQLVGPEKFDRTICYDDLATGGSLIIFGPNRDILQVVYKFLAFFIEESCGYCTPCRVGNRLLLQKIGDIIGGQGEPDDLAYLESLGTTIKTTSRCGLGQTSPNPVLTSLTNFMHEYKKRVQPTKTAFRANFDIRAALQNAEELAGRKSSVYAPAINGGVHEP